jgi:kynurenine formamidase
MTRYHRHWAAVAVVVGVVGCISTGASSFAVAQEPAAKSDSVLAVSLGQLASGDAKLIDLTYPLNDKSPFWPGDNYQPFQLRTIATLEQNGVLSKTFAMPEHFGTHLDAPCHFEKGQPSVEAIRSEDLFAAGVLIDVTMQAETDADYRLTPSDIAVWEKVYGRIPDRSIVLIRTGWSRFWERMARYRNQDATGRMHFPGFSADAARWLVKERNVRAIGIDTLSIDHGPSKDFVVHHVINGAGRYALENVAHLDKLPPRDFFLIVAPIKIETGSGGPTRLFAVLPREQ